MAFNLLKPNHYPTNIKTLHKDAHTHTPKYTQEKCSKADTWQTSPLQANQPCPVGSGVAISFLAGKSKKEALDVRDPRAEKVLAKRTF